MRIVFVVLMDRRPALVAQGGLFFCLPLEEKVPAGRMRWISHTTSIPLIYPQTRGGLPVLFLRPESEEARSTRQLST